VKNRNEIRKKKIKMAEEIQGFPLFQIIDLICKLIKELISFLI